MPGSVMSSTRAVLTMSQAVSALWMLLTATRAGAVSGSGVACAQSREGVASVRPQVRAANNLRFWCILLPFPTTHGPEHFLCQWAPEPRESPYARQRCERLQCCHSLTAALPLSTAGDRGDNPVQPENGFSASPEMHPDHKPTSRGSAFFWPFFGRWGHRFFKNKRNVFVRFVWQSGTVFSSFEMTDVRWGL